MNPLPYLPALVAALAAAVCGVLFILSFTAWLLCEPCIRRGRYAPRPWLSLAVWTLLATATYLLLP
jgi:hypothetical protein